MKIQCKLVRSGGTRVEFGDNFRGSGAPAASYHFKPIDPNNVDSPHIAEVLIEAHQERLLSLPEAYRLYADGQPTASTSVQPPPAPKKPATVGETSKVEHSPTVAALLELSTKDLKATINTYPNDDLRAALAAEKTRTDDTPRKSFIAVLEAHLGDGA